MPGVEGEGDCAGLMDMASTRALARVVKRKNPTLNADITVSLKASSPVHILYLAHHGVLLVV